MAALAALAAGPIASAALAAAGSAKSLTALISAAIAGASARTLTERIAGVAQPLVLQAVHHVLHRLVRLPPAAVAAWGGIGSEIVVIQRGLPESGLRASFEAALIAGVGSS